MMVLTYDCLAVGGAKEEDGDTNIRVAADKAGNILSQATEETYQSATATTL
jgi:hypothetical protein